MDKKIDNLLQVFYKLTPANRKAVLRRARRLLNKQKKDARFRASSHFSVRGTR